MIRETRRERILDNRTKALLVAEKQRHNLAKARNTEKRKGRKTLVAIIMIIFC